MKKPLMLVTALLSFLPAFSQEDNLFGFRIEQGGESIPLREGVYELEAETFKIEATFEGTEALYVNFSTNPALYDAVVAGEDFQKILGFGGTGMAEDFGNPDFDIWLVDGGWHVWFVQDSDFSRFDFVVMTDMGNIGIRTVETVYDVESGKTLALDELDTIYVVLCDAEYVDGYQVNGVQAFSLEFE